ncbi:hypothetical protein [Bartonella vinsonii]|uniref:hypothetical protein n=1 Tax=Bartonella vinsonii TaxID=33047 RepID=UPI0012DEF9BD|nr:hypothetical protein [Bartonella vinsonii]
MTEIMIHFHDMHPFKEEKKHIKQIFIEKRTKAEDQKFNFSLVTKKRKIFVRTTALYHGDQEPIKHSLENISNPEELLVLKELYACHEGI